MSTETQELKAGRELDCEIAVKVFGRKLMSVGGTCLGKWRSGYVEGCHVTFMMEEGGKYQREGVPSFSTVIGDAWEVVNRFVGFRSQKPCESAPFVVALYTDNLRECTGSAKTFPEAICLAALKSVESEILRRSNTGDTNG